jgi:hypothetical protein
VLIWRELLAEGPEMEIVTALEGQHELFSKQLLAVVFEPRGIR